MTIFTEIVARAAQKITEYDLIQTEALCDRIHAAQPHVFLTALALSQDGVSMAKMDHVLHVLRSYTLPLRCIKRE